MIRFFLGGALALFPVVASAQTPVSLPQIQGKTDVSPLAGQSIQTTGVVTGIFPGLKGFYIQDAQGDGDAQTSDGAFVYFPGSNLALHVGQRVKVSGQVEEFHNQTQIGHVSAVDVLGEAEPLAPVEVKFPLPVTSREALEGMLVRVATPMFVSDSHGLKRYGSLGLASGGREFNPTNVSKPPTSDEASARQLVLDDGSSKSNPKPLPFLDAQGTRRAGDEIAGLTGVLAFNYGQYCLLPVEMPVFQNTNPRPLRTPDVGGTLKIGSANLHNYWTTLKDQSHPDARGSATPAAFAVQSAKVVAMLRGLDADAVSLMELENNGDGALDDLVSRLNAAYGAKIYAKVPMPSTGLGDDKIRVGMIYKPAKLQLVGAPKSATDGIFDRRPLAQLFADRASGARFWVVANHWKSKGSAPDSGDIDTGQGAWNLKRIKQAKATLAFVQTLQKSDADVLIAGDLNAYSEEDPLKTLRAANMKHLNLRLKPEERYSFAYDGKFGSLDHAVVTPELDKQVTGFAEWHINADEPDFEQTQSKGTPFRASDHDPFLVGLKLKTGK
jgi:predicted extracellular nuclease